MKDCQFGVSPINYSDSDSDTVHTTTKPVPIPNNNISIYLSLILQHPLSSIMCSWAVSARVKLFKEIKSAIVRLDKIYIVLVQRR